MQDIRTKRHVVHSLHLHLVFVTKFRKKVFTEKMYQRLHFHFDRGIIQVSQTRVPRTGNVLLERRIMVSKLFYRFLWRSSTKYS